MTSNSEDEAFHFRGKSLSPESPQPLHIPEPANIPILQHQMDLEFNDTSKYKTSDDTQPASPDLRPEIRDQLRLARQFSSQTFAALDHEDDNFGAGSQGTGSSHKQAQGGDLDAEENKPSYLMHHDALLSSQIESALVESSLGDMVNQESSTPHFKPTPHADRPVPHEPQVLSESSHPKSFPIPTHDPESDSSLEYVPNETEQIRTAGEGRSSPAPDQINYQSLLDTLSSSVSDAPSSTTITATTPPIAADSSLLPSKPEGVAPLSAGLPPRPPPQEKPLINSNYAPTNNIRSFHPLHNRVSNDSSKYSQSSQEPLHLPSNIQPTVGGSGSLSVVTSLHPPPPPPVTFQQLSPSSGVQSREQSDKQAVSSHDGDEEAPWGPDIQRKYDGFLQNERAYVTEGVWDRFPPGSRLFIGNLPTEKVTKRDLFHLFHEYGDLAQISIKQAYGFIQFLDDKSCSNALRVEQGSIIRGRKIHLEVSKPQPQRAQRHAQPDSLRSSGRKRSRSPEYTRPSHGTRGPRSSVDRYDRIPDTRGSPPGRFGTRDEPYRRRDDYRPMRSPSARGYRRNDYRHRDRSAERCGSDRDRRRSRSPFRRKSRYRSPSPAAGAGGHASDSDLPMPRRGPQEVPEVQILVLEEIDRNFLYQAESTFRDKGLKTDVFFLSPRISVAAVVRRQIIEGVLAIVKLSRSHQYSRKIPLQVFDRSSGVDNVRFNGGPSYEDFGIKRLLIDIVEYSELEPNVAADVVLHVRVVQHGIVPNQKLAFQAPNISQLPVQRPAVPLSGGTNNLANLISTLDPQSLQTLIGALHQNPNAIQAVQKQYPSSSNIPLNLANLLSNRAPQNPLISPSSNNPFSPTAPSYGIPSPTVTADPTLASLLLSSANQRAAPSQSSQVPPHVQNIMDQLTKWKQ
ncbi:hypothetical protein AJ80_03134 [Polytolypa hystricis UAMH7299]|uniref:RRM domain-containing protein n=1 Tax=Polytolypa hystricis (strain UAMH7299) TaxID=1447883 RepID=A0A2B7YBX1_POLH7|nr:hypothetical protein AJ80_03134 [Polytolypa hystricis UAMH7299]